MLRSLKRKQNTVVEIEPGFDLSGVLPNKNDFRTSLLMPDLCARFSMLREQDGPVTQVGKASVGSVLCPKRASRLNLFAHNPLTDLAEVESIRSSLVKPPLANNERSNSFSEGTGYSNDDTRNTLYSGRQELYRIPGVRSARDLTSAQPPLTSAEHRHQKDAAMSSFQQLRLKWGEGPHEQGYQEERDDFPECRVSTETDDHECSDVVNIPLTGFSENRWTVSSKASSPSNRRISTAATSLVSDFPLPRQSQFHAKDTAPDHEPDDNFLARNPSCESRRGRREGEEQGQRPLTSPSPLACQLRQSRGVANMSKGSSRESSPSSFAMPPTSSPSHSARPQTFAFPDVGLKSTGAPSKEFQITAPSTADESGKAYVKDIESNDRGKAIAMGQLKRPPRPFDEQKFQERQLQMHKGRLPSTAAASIHIGELATQKLESAHPTEPIVLSSVLPLEPGPARRTSDESTTGRSKTKSALFNSAAQGHARIEGVINGQNEGNTALQAQKAYPENSHAFKLTDGVSSAVQIARPHSLASTGTSFPPAMNDIRDTWHSLHSSCGTRMSNSPVLRPTTGLCLVTLIRTHLRQDSEKSSFMPPPSPMPHVERSDFSLRNREFSIGSFALTINTPERAHSDPWEFDKEHHPQWCPTEQPSIDHISSMSQKAQQILGQAMSHRKHATYKAQQVLGLDAPTNTDDDAARGRQNDMTYSHQHGGSIEWQKESGNELPERAKKIQEGHKGVADTAKQTHNPFRSNRQAPAARALHACRQKASKESLASRANESHPQAMKTRGLQIGSHLDIRGQSEFA
ncbi:hypothetical protein LTR41_011605 [Exophiala xenobiotica]|nr:hypothetical protein LTR41_011605 [Exophiala xenobiotica]KAK5550545.1 hypothetical protein LTR46_011451 [Exophiala xenobiotica]